MRLGTAHHGGKEPCARGVLRIKLLKSGAALLSILRLLLEKTRGFCKYIFAYLLGSSLIV